MMDFKKGSWLRLSVVNISIVALFGALMRYKIGYEFPHFEQKNLQHAHSHFAFIGWITHTLFVLMMSILQKDRAHTDMRKYRWIVISNLVCAYGMLVSFSTSGYSAISIALSTASIIIGYVFAVFFFGDLKKMPDTAYKYWFTAGLWFNIISSLGTFTLAIMMATHNFNQKVYLASLYYYLHFQYNGFFFFVCMGLLFAFLKDFISPKHNRRIFWIFFTSCIPAYFLSILWMKVPAWMYALIVLSAVAQVYAWFMLVKKGTRRWSDALKDFKAGKYIFLIIVIALSIKFLLQLGSTIPIVGKLAFGFRPIIIAYLHLILLAIISVFLITYMFLSGYLRINRWSLAALISFVLGVYLNELILGVQGIASFSYTSVPYANQMLFIVSVFIFLSLLLMVFSQARSSPGEI
jgi:hypothetical protein